MDYYVYDSEGNIVRSGECQPEVMHLAGGDGLTVAPGKANGKTQYVDIATGELRNYDAEAIERAKQFPPEPGYRWSLGRWIDERDLNQAKFFRWSMIKKARAEEEFGTFLVGGYEFDCDKDSQTRINSAFQAAIDARTNGEPFSIDWTLSDDTNVTLNRAQVIAVGRALQEHVNAVFDKSRQLRAQIIAATTKEELDGISW